VIEVIVLGSGTPIPVPERGGSALAVASDDAWVLVDCGRSATQRAIDAGLDLTTVVAVAITHHHSDHISDLATFATTRWTAGASAPLTVLAPVGPAAKFAQQCLSAFDDQSFYGQADDPAAPRPRIDVRAFAASDAASVVYRQAGWTISSALVDHHPVTPAVGYLVEHDAHRVAVSGDTAVCDGMRALARDVDVLVHEALLSRFASPDILDWNASARAVGELSAAVGPRQVVLTHLIPAPRGEADERAYVDEVRAGGYEGNVVVARDLLRMTIEP
jgi:ribonuclease Z